MTRTRSALLFFAAASLFSSVNVHADPIELLYLAGGELRSVGFDGTSFIGGYTSLETPNPEMSGISYDPIDDILYYLAGGELRSVGFDGTSFIGGYTSLETPNPEMSGISVIHAALSVSEPGTLALLSIGLLGMGLARLKRA